MWKASHALTKAPLDQHAGIVESLKPEPGDALYADKMTGYEQARALAARLRASAMDDSAAYILSGNTDAVAAFTDIFTEGKTPEGQRHQRPNMRP